ncbi:MAG: hypothetical protein ACLRWP_13790 [Bilophila wadsworthia]
MDHHRTSTSDFRPRPGHRGAICRWILCPDARSSDLDAIVNAKTRLVAVGYASNAVDHQRRLHLPALPRGRRAASVDAVHIAPHRPSMDAIGADMLFCSVYKPGTYRHRGNPKERVWRRSTPTACIRLLHGPRQAETDAEP